jgi:hypothetical protein
MLSFSSEACFIPERTTHNHENLPHVERPEGQLLLPPTWEKKNVDAPWRMRPCCGLPWHGCAWRLVRAQCTRTGILKSSCARPLLCPPSAYIFLSSASSAEAARSLRLLAPFVCTVHPSPVPIVHALNRHCRQDEILIHALGLCGHGRRCPLGW